MRHVLCAILCDLSPLLSLTSHPDMNYEESRAAVQRAVAFLKETDGLLNIDDVLPFLPDFSIIDDVKVRREVGKGMRKGEEGGREIGEGEDHWGDGS